MYTQKIAIIFDEWRAIVDLDHNRLGTDRLLTSQWGGGFGGGVQCNGGSAINT